MLKKEEEKILEKELDKFLLILECRLDLFGALPHEPYQWNKEKILNEVKSQINKAIDI